MPNWCFNKIRISGPSGQLAAFLKAAEGVADDGAVLSPLSLERLLPEPPQASVDQDAGARDHWRSENWGTDRDVQDASLQDASLQDASLQDASPQDASPQDASPQDASPQDASPQDASLQETCAEWSEAWPEGRREVLLTCHSAWTPPLAALRKISELFCQLVFQIDYDEPNWYFAGIAEFRAGDGGGWCGGSRLADAYADKEDGTGEADAEDGAERDAEDDTGGESTKWCAPDIPGMETQ